MLLFYRKNCQILLVERRKTKNKLPIVFQKKSANDGGGKQSKIDSKSQKPQTESSFKLIVNSNLTEVGRTPAHCKKVRGGSILDFFGGVYKHRFLLHKQLELQFIIIYFRFFCIFVNISCNFWSWCFLHVYFLVRSSISFLLELLTMLYKTSPRRLGESDAFYYLLQYNQEHHFLQASTLPILNKSHLSKVYQWLHQ